MTTTAQVFHAGIHKTTQTALDPTGVDAKGHQHQFDTPFAVEDGVRQVAGRLNAITEHVGQQLDRLASVTSEEDRKAIAFQAAGALRDALREVRAPAEALARAEVIAALDSEIQGWVQIDAERRNKLLGGPVPPQNLVAESRVNELAREAQVPLVQFYTSKALDGTEVRDVYWPSGAFSTSTWIPKAPIAARRWRKPPVT